MKKEVTKFDVIIIGAGAAGMMCAIEAGKRRRNVLVLEKNKTIGNKILISGGGRCNFTNINAVSNNYVSQNNHFIKSVFSKYSYSDFIELVEKYEIDYYEKTLGQLFCRKSSREILNLLEAEAELYNIKIKLNSNIQSVKKNKNFIIETDDEIIESDSLVMACGGLSFPSKGASDFGYKIAKQFNIKIIPTFPALVPFTLDSSKYSELLKLSGLSFEAKVGIKNEKVKFIEKVLITHRGLSGPAILQISSYWNKSKTIQIKIEPNLNWEKLIFNQSQSQDLKLILSQYLPNRFGEYIVSVLNINKNISNFNNIEKEQTLNFLNSWEIIPSGTEGYAKAEVTAGGIDTNEINQKTMEIKKVEGLFFIGELVDVTGWLGGYNFQWAWSSGYIAGQNV